MNIIYLKDRLREKTNLKKALRIELGAYKAAFEQLNDIDAARIKKQAARIQEEIHKISPSAKMGELSALELLANIAPFLEKK